MGRITWEKIKKAWKSGLIDEKFGLGRIEVMLASKWFNPFGTLWLNFRSFPLKQAIKIPIFVFGRPRLFTLSGNMKVEGKVSPGMIKFNKDMHGAPSNMCGQTEIVNRGTIIFRGPGLIGTGNKIRVSKGTELKIGAKFKITDWCNISVENGVEIGDETWIVHRSQVMDTNFHFIADFEKNEIGPRSKPIKIGKHCWISNTAIVMGGAVIPDYSIVGSFSIVNKDYSDCPVGTLFVGSPAKPKRNGLCRVDNSKIEEMVWKYSHEHSAPFPLDGLTLEDM